MKEPSHQLLNICKPTSLCVFIGVDLRKTIRRRHFDRLTGKMYGQTQTCETVFIICVTI